MRKFISVLLSIILVLNSFSFVAATENTIPIDNQSNYYILYSSDGEILSYNMPSSYNITRAEDGTYLKSIPLRSGSKNRVDCGYHPDTQTYWNPACYYFTKSRSVSVGFTFSIGSEKYGASLEFSAMGNETNATAGSFPADSTRLSKVRIYAYFDYVLYRGEVRDMRTDELYSTFTYTTLTKTGEFFEVVFKE